MVTLLSRNKYSITIGKSSHFSGQPLYGQVIKLLDKSKILEISREKGGERYTKRFNGWIHLVVMLYAVSCDSIHYARLQRLCWLKHINWTPWNNL